MAKGGGGASREARWPPVSYWMKVAAGVLVVLAVARLLLAIGDILVLILIAAVLALGFQPAVEWLERRGLRRGWAVTLGLLVGLLVIGVFLWLALPGIIAQSTELVEDAPQLLEQAKRNFPLLGDVSEQVDLSQRLRSLSSDLPGILLGVAGSATTLVLGSLTVLVLTIYFTVNLPRLRASIAGLLHPEDRDEFERILGESIRRVGGYVLGNLVISLIAGVVSFIALSIIGVKFAAAIAFIVAILDLIPTIGAILAAVIATLVAALTGVGDMIATLAFFLAYQQVENYLIQPRVMRSAIDMSAPAVIVSVLIGGALLGIIGALLALPVAAVIKVAFQELYLEDRREAVRRADG